MGRPRRRRERRSGALTGGGNGAAGYRGPDRRGVVASEGRLPGHLFVLAGVGLLLLLSVAGSTRVSGPTLDPAAVDLLAVQLDAAAFALTLLIAALCFVRWRLVGESSLLWLGTASLLYGTTTLAWGYVETLGLDARFQYASLLRTAGLLVVVILTIRALTAPEVDVSVRPLPVLGWSLVAVVSASGVLRFLPTETWRIGDVEVASTAGQDVGFTTLAFVLLWTGLGTWALWIGMHRRHVFSWFSLSFFALAFARLISLVPTADGSLGAASPALLRGYGLTCAAVGITYELSRSYVRQSNQLLETAATARSAEVRIELERATQAERTHEARNALSAIEGASLTLERYRDQLPPDARSQLAEAVSTEIHRLQQLITPPPAQQPNGRFRLHEAVAAVITCARWQGADLTVDIPEHLVAIGRPAETTQVLQNLVQNAQRYGGGRIMIRGRVVEDRVVVEVHDDGPGIPLEEREKVFTRGVRGRTAAGTSGSGLGLFISTRLVEELGGSIWVEESPWGGASVAFSLPGFSELAQDLDEDQGEAHATAGGELVAFVRPRAHHTDDDPPVGDDALAR